MKASNSSMRGSTVQLSAMLIATVAALGCGSESEPAGTVCGGVVRDGTCLQRCEDSLCNPGNICVFTPERTEGYCTVSCESNDGCPWGHACVSDVQTANDPGSYCLDLELPGQGAVGATCSTDEDCDVGHGVGCFEGSCAFPCPSVLSDCPDGTMCKGDPDAASGEAGGYCVAAQADWLVPGRYGTDCPLGDEQCDVAAGFECVGPQGTPDANCSKPDGCVTDADCPSGYWCGETRVVENDVIDFARQPKTCLRREFCSPCESDVDCSHTTNAICVPDANGEGFCSTPCEVGADSCVIGARCEELGDGRTACRPDRGVCHVSEPQGCDPCRVDSDCGPNAVCYPGAWGYKPAMPWCSTPCGGPDSFGKNTCPVAPNGLEMLCLDENQLLLGGPFDETSPAHAYEHCYAPITVDNTERFPGEDPPNNACGNWKIESGEECDDGNTDPAYGCADCMVTAACTFTIEEPNGDGDPALTPVPNHIKISGTGLEPNLPLVISTSLCTTFKVEGAIEEAGDIDVIAIMIPNGASMWIDTFTSSVGSCTADLTTEARAWKNGEKASDESLLDLSVPCEALSDDPENYASTGYACPGSPTHLGCGSCDGPGVCGVCDKDSGYGNCNRLWVQTTTLFGGQYPVYFDGRYKVLRVYSSDPAMTVGNFVLIGNRFVESAPMSPSTPPTIGCY